MKTKIFFLLALAILLSLACKTQQSNNSNVQSTNQSDYFQEVTDYQKQLTSDYIDPESPPLDHEQVKSFTKSGGHQFFEIDPAYRVEAVLDTTITKKDIGFETSTDRIAMYDKIGVAKFEINFESYNLSIYESHYYRGNPEYDGHLFLPFNDLTNSDSTYGGGRYIDVIRQESNIVIIDFNKSYNPYCAYSTKYSCPVPPRENFLNLEVKAGIKYESKSH